jgi:hypothetical protein
MAKQDKIVPARRQREKPDDSLLIRSAESLGRVIGTLQRQLDGATRRISKGAGQIADLVPSRGDSGASAPATRTTARKPAAATGAPKAARKTAGKPGAATSKTARKAARKPAAATSKTAARPAARKNARATAPARRAASAGAKKTTAARGSAKKAAAVPKTRGR